jgi:hypothetical protein
MPNKDKSSQSKWVPPKSTPTPKPPSKVNFGVANAATLKKTILKMSDQELKAYSKQIGVSYDGNNINFLWAAIAKYNSQQ